MKGPGRPSATGVVAHIHVSRAAIFFCLAALVLLAIALHRRDRTPGAPMQPPGAAQGLPSAASGPPIFFRTIRRQTTSSFLNTPLGSFTQDPRSAGWLAQLDGSESYGLWVDSTIWTPPVYYANQQTPKAKIRLTSDGDVISIPYLPSFKPDPSGDSQLAVIDADTGCDYEFQAFDPASMTANSEATFNVETGTGRHANDVAVTGSGISELGGLITPADVASGSIDHALRYATPMNASTFVAPATRSDGGEPGGIPAGELMRLDPSLDLSQFYLTPFQMMVARALQEYGAYNADSAGSFKLYAENTIDGSRYHRILSPLPWSVMSHLQFGTTAYAAGELNAETNRLAGCSRPHEPARPHKSRHKRR